MDDPPVDLPPETDAAPPVSDPPPSPDPAVLPDPATAPSPVEPDPVWCEYQPPSYDTPLPVEEHGRYWFSGSRHLIPANQVADLLKTPGFRKVSPHV